MTDHLLGLDVRAESVRGRTTEAPRPSALDDAGRDERLAAAGRSGVAGGLSERR